MNDNFIVEAVPIPILEQKMIYTLNVFSMTTIHHGVLVGMMMRISLIATCVVRVMEESLIQLWWACALIQMMEQRTIMVMTVKITILDAHHVVLMIPLALLLIVCAVIVVVVPQNVEIWMSNKCGIPFLSRVPRTMRIQITVINLVRLSQI